MEKILSVCLAKDLPKQIERSSDHMYFVYDKMDLFIGQDLYGDNFAIANTFPSDPIDQFIYILTDGTVHQFIENADVTIARIDRQDQLPVLASIGTSFIVNKNRRYLDDQYRHIVLPYTDGTYQLVYDSGSEVEYDNDTVLKYDTDKEGFKVYSGTDYPLLPTRDFEGKKTTTVDINVKDHMITGKVRISNKDDNILKEKSDGLYATVSDKVSIDTFDNWQEKVYSPYIDEINKYMTAISRILGNTTEEGLQETILNILKDSYATIDDALVNYTEYSEKIDSIESNVTKYVDKTYEETADKLSKSLQEYSEWDELEDLSYLEDFWTDDDANFDPTKTWATLGVSEDFNMPLIVKEVWDTLGPNYDNAAINSEFWDAIAGDVWFDLNSTKSEQFDRPVSSSSIWSEL